jgi:hypothetical protein
MTACGSGHRSMESPLLSSLRGLRWRAISEPQRVASGKRLQSLKESFWNNRLGIAKEVANMDHRGGIHEGELSVLQSVDF